MSISPTFYDQLFCTKVFCASYSLLTVRVCNFFIEMISAKKGGRKMLVKITGVHVTTVRALDDFRNNPHAAASMLCHAKLPHLS